MEKIGNYQIVRSLGEGGMGKVFLARDPICRRVVALKQIRSELAKSKTIQERFLREAKIAAQLAHPSIIPIYAIHEHGDKSYYTMPYVEGETLKQILRITRDQEKLGQALHPIGGSIPALIRIFLNVCQAVAYTHSKGIIHRDLKPENIIIGKYGEVLILDWGLADFIDRPETAPEEEFDDALFKDLTHPGKIAGTITYIPPERAMGELPSIQLDIYALGVILYQLLTLRMPFQRTTLEHFRKVMKHERLIDPIEAAPYRDIPPRLSDIVKKCLSDKKELRYQSVQGILAEVQNYHEGSPEWMLASELNIHEKSDWEFQENILLAKHIAITRTTDVMEWVSLMISKKSFSGNFKMQALVKLEMETSGIGLLFNIPENSVRKGLEDGYCLWLNSSVKLFRANVEVMHIPDVSLSKEVWHLIQVEKTDNHVRFFLDGALILDYLSHIPVGGTHVGMLLRDGDFELEGLKVFVGSQNLMVSCLAIPDAFLASREYSKALAEYRRIGYSFPGRAEGREALFRAGITLLEEAEHSSRKKHLHTAALEEFSQLHATPGAPLEYLGKSLVYKKEGDTEEEIKCLELALRKYPMHPLLPVVVEHIVFRMHESSFYDRIAAYHFALLAIRHLPSIFANPDHERLLTSLTKHLEPLPFLESTKESTATALGFWLAKPLILLELLEKDRSNVLFALLELGCFDLLKDYPEVHPALLCHEVPLKKALEKLNLVEDRNFLHAVRYALDEQKADLVLPLLKKLPSSPRVDQCHIWALLLENKWEEAGSLLETYPLEERLNERSPLYFLFGCWLFATEGAEIGNAHFASAYDSAYPPTSALLSHFLKEKINIKKLLFWEKVALYRQLALFYHCTEEHDRVSYFLKRLKKEILRTRSHPI
ncbi:MAG: protein kinase [Chlamydiota bacterium]